MRPTSSSMRTGRCATSAGLRPSPAPAASAGKAWTSASSASACALHSEDDCMNRRDFTRTLAAGLTTAALPAAAVRKLRIGHTCLTWNAAPRTPENLEEAVRDIGDLGFHSWETFAEVLESWDSKGTLAGLIEKYKVPLTSGYFTANVTDPSLRKENIEKVTKFSRIVKKYGGTFLVLAANGVKRAEYSFSENKANVVGALNDYAKAAVDAGVATGFHQHTG